MKQTVQGVGIGLIVSTAVHFLFILSIDRLLRHVLASSGNGHTPIEISGIVEVLFSFLVTLYAWGPVLSSFLPYLLLVAAVYGIIIGSVIGYYHNHIRPQQRYRLGVVFSLLVHLLPFILLALGSIIFNLLVVGIESTAFQYYMVGGALLAAYLILTGIIVGLISVYFIKIGRRMGLTTDNDKVFRK